MEGYFVTSGVYELEEFGRVNVTVRRNARAVSARWKEGRLRVTLPYGMAYSNLMATLRSLSDRIETIKPETPYHFGQTLDYGELKVVIKQQTHSPDKVMASFRAGAGSIEVGTGWDITSNACIKTINKFLCRMAQAVAAQVLLPRARELAAQVGRQPLMWTISNGHRVLGHCSATGVIALSYVLVFYPRHLRDYVIFHELSHLTEMNHSAAFHEICNAYCQGREKLLERQLKDFYLPILK